MNLRFTDGPAQKLTKVRNPSRKILGWELRAPYDAMVCYCGGDTPDKLADRHFGMGNFVFVDGHVELLAPSQIVKVASYFQFTDNQDDCGGHWAQDP